MSEWKTILQFQGQYRWLSNFWPVTVALDGVDYPSVEHAYQAAKTLDPMERRCFLSGSAGAAKRAGRHITLRPDWEQEKVKVMYLLLTAKFKDAELAEKLLATGEAELEEGNTWGDKFWGKDIRTGEGENTLGKLLMLVRADLRCQQTSANSQIDCSGIELRVAAQELEKQQTEAVLTLGGTVTPIKLPDIVVSKIIDLPPAAMPEGGDALLEALCGPETFAGSGVRLNDQQSETSDRVINWVEMHREVREGSRKWDPDMTEEEAVAGLAGTGKTTVMGYVVRTLRDRGIKVAVVAPTGKAASVLRAKGVQGAKTIHGFAYNFDGVEVNEHTGKEQPKFDRKMGLDLRPDVLFADESSMINREMKQDLMKFRLPIVWFGDHGQLPPIGEDPRILENARWKLETIMRQAEGSSILPFAYYLRTLRGPIPEKYLVEREDLKVRRMGLSIAMREIAAEYVSRLGDDARFDGYQAIVGYNDTRFDLNRFIRQQMGADKVGDLCENERVLIVRTNYEHGVYNGEQYTVTAIHKLNKYKETVTVDLRGLGVCADETRENVEIFLPTLFRDPQMKDAQDRDVVFAQHGYAITAHKSQGSEWEDVAVIDQPVPFKEPERWRYTAATRAKKTLVYYA